VLLCCQIACKDEHVSNDWTPIAKPQPDTGQFWLKLNQLNVPVAVYHTPLPVDYGHIYQYQCTPWIRQDYRVGFS